MKFGTRLTLSMVAPIIILIVGFGYVDERRSRDHFREELRREGRAITRTVQLSMQDAIRDRDTLEVRELVDQITGFERVFGLRVFSADGRLVYQSKLLEPVPFLSVEVLHRVLEERRPAESQRLLNGRPALTYFSPLTSPDGSLFGAVQVLQLESFIDEEVRAARNGIMALTLAMMVVTASVIFLVTRFVVDRPIRRFVYNLRAIDPAAADAQLPVVGGDELKRLAREFNALLRRLEDSHRSLLAEQDERRRTELKLKNAERLAALGQLAAGLAHEIGTPLNVIGGRTELLLRRRLEGEQVESNLRIIAEQINRITRIVREMVEFAQIKEISPVPVDIGELLASVVEFLEYRFGQEKIAVDLDVPGGLKPVMADRDQIYEVFLNLFINAIDSMGGGGTLRIAARPSRSGPDAPDEFVAVTIEDTGSGIGPGDLERIFDPFYTTKGVGKGSGLGLSVSYGIVREHGGTIEVESEPGRGTRVTVQLPVRLRAAVPPSPATASPGGGGGGSGAVG